MSFPKLLTISSDEIDTEEISIDDLTDMILKDIINSIITKVKNQSREIYGQEEYRYMYGRLKHECELELGDLIYETLELKHTIKRLKI